MILQGSPAPQIQIEPPTVCSDHGQEGGILQSSGGVVLLDCEMEESRTESPVLDMASLKNPSINRIAQSPLLRRYSECSTAEVTCSRPEYPPTDDCDGLQFEMDLNEGDQSADASHLDCSHLLDESCLAVSFKTEVTGQTGSGPNSLRQSQRTGVDSECVCKEEVDDEEADALALALEESSKQPALPHVPGLSPIKNENKVGQILSIMHLL